MNYQLVTDKPMETPINPYEIMANDIALRVISQLPKQEILTKEQVIELVREDLEQLQTTIHQEITERIKGIGSTRVIIEDRRKQPHEIKEISEPVHNKMPDVIGILKAGCWACAVGPTGSGKTLGALQYAKIAGIKIVCVKQMTRILAPHDLIGFIDANGKYRAGAWTNGILGRVYDNSLGNIPSTEQDGEEHSLLIVDEMDNSNENIVMLIKALQTGYIMMPYGLQRVNPNLYVMATMNTWGTGATREYVGRMAQDAALLNEFSFVEWDYDTSFEWSLLENLFNSYKEPGEYTIQHMQMLHSMFKGMRAKAEQQKIRVIISTRNIINTAKKLLENPKWPIHKVLMMDVYKGLKEEDIKRVECPEQWTAVSSHGSKPITKQVVNKSKTADGIPF